MSKIKSFRMFAITMLAIAAAFTATSAHAQYSVLYYFGGIQNQPPANPNGSIAQGRDGNLYGTSSSGGTNDMGTVFKITPAGDLNVIYNFCSQPNCADGSNPTGLVLRPDGHFIGTTYSGGSNGVGTIFDVSPAGTLTTLYNFTGHADGGNPRTGPILGADGEFYGVAYSGGAPSGCGTIYRLSAVYTVIHRFNFVLGCFPVASLVLGTDGSYYGTTIGGGKADIGVVYKLTYRPGQSTLFTELHDFANDTYIEPQAPLVEGSDGNFYGLASGGGAGSGPGAGAIFKITPIGDLTVLHALNGTTDGGSPVTGMALGTDGNFYGTASGGGNTDQSCTDTGCGTLFQITPAGSYTTLYTFDWFTGSSPSSTPLQHTSGLFYGETGVGGISLAGVFYSWNGSLPAFVSSVQLMGAVGSTVEILGQGFTSTSTVSFNGVTATATVQSETSLFATVPAAATTGSITVTTSSGTLTSNRPFIVTP